VLKCSFVVVFGDACSLLAYKWLQEGTIIKHHDVSHTGHIWVTSSTAGGPEWVDSCSLPCVLHGVQNLLIMGLVTNVISVVWHNCEIVKKYLWRSSDEVLLLFIEGFETVIAIALQWKVLSFTQFDG